MDLETVKVFYRCCMRKIKMNRNKCTGVSHALIFASEIPKLFDNPFAFKKIVDKLQLRSNKNEMTFHLAKRCEENCLVVTKITSHQPNTSQRRT